MWQIIELPLPIVWGLSGGGGATTWREEKKKKNPKKKVHREEKYKIKIGDTVANVNASEHFSVRFFFSPSKQLYYEFRHCRVGKKKGLATEGLIPLLATVFRWLKLSSLAISGVRSTVETPGEV